MASNCFACMRICFNSSTSHVPLQEIPSVTLDTTKMGNDVVIVKNGKRICGAGCALASAPIAQDKAYFEVKIQQTGVWSVGLAVERVDLNRVPMGEDVESWVLRQDGHVWHNGEKKQKLPEEICEGDVLGVTYDHVELNFYINGRNLHFPTTGMKGTLYPAFSVDDGAILDVSFSDFTGSIPAGYDKVMIEQQLL